MATKNQKNDGRAAEEIVQRITTVYKRNAILNLEKVEQPCRILYLPGGRQRIIWLTNPHLDFHGAWTRHNGRMLAIEVKSTIEPRLPINGASGLTETQIDAMRNWGCYGATVALLWFIDFNRQCWMVPYSTVYNAIMQKRKSLTPQTDFMIQCPPGDGNVMFDFEQIMHEYFAEQCRH